MKINWLRVIVLVNAGMTALLFYLLFELHKVVVELGYAMVFMARVVAFIAK